MISHSRRQRGRIAARDTHFLPFPGETPPPPPKPAAARRLPTRACGLGGLDRIPPPAKRPPRARARGEARNPGWAGKRPRLPRVPVPSRGRGTRGAGRSRGPALLLAALGHAEAHVSRLPAGPRAGARRRPVEGGGGKRVNAEEGVPGNSQHKLGAVPRSCLRVGPPLSLADESC